MGDSVSPLQRAWSYIGPGFSRGVTPKREWLGARFNGLLALSLQREFPASALGLKATDSRSPLKRALTLCATAVTPAEAGAYAQPSPLKRAEESSDADGSASACPAPAWHPGISYLRRNSRGREPPELDSLENPAPTGRQTYARPMPFRPVGAGNHMSDRSGGSRPRLKAFALSGLKTRRPRHR